MQPSDPFTESIKKTLDQQSLDEDTRRKLAEARRQALDAVEVARPEHYRPAMLALASIAVLAIAVSLTFWPKNQAVTVDSIESFEIITSQESLELYEDLEFYVWLGEQLPGEG